MVKMKGEAEEKNELQPRAMARQMKHHRRTPLCADSAKW